MSRVRLVLSCGYERQIDSLTMDAFDVNQGDAGFCPEHPFARVESMWIDDEPRISAHRREAVSPHGEKVA